MIWQYDLDENGHLRLAWCAGADSPAGWSIPEELDDPVQFWADKVIPEDRDRAKARVERLLQGKPSVDDFRVSGDGGVKTIRVFGMPEQDPESGRVTRVFAALDPTGVANADGQQSHDPATGLRDHAALHDALAEAIARREDTGEPISIMTVELDFYGDVAADFGTAAADTALRTAARRFEAALGEDALAARLYGDHLAALVPNVTLEQFQAFAKAVSEALQEPIEVDGIELRLEPSIGLSHYPKHGTGARYLLRRSILAADAARERGRAFAVYESDHEERARRNLRLLHELRRALAAEQLEVHFQPIVDLRSRRFVRAEALLRWTHPERGPVSPGAFIPMAERTSLIGPLTLWVLEQAIAQVERWQATGQRIAASVNVSVRNLLDDELYRALNAAFAEGRIRPGDIGLEVTESEVMRDPEACIESLNRLRALGIDILVDDFGTGHSSLVYLQRMPLSLLKIDGSFVRDMTTNAASRAIVQTTVTLAGQLGFGAIAEGVETRGELELLRDIGCREAQGFHIARPLPAEELTLDEVA